MGRVGCVVYVNIKCQVPPCAKQPCRYERKIKVVGEKHKSAKKNWKLHPRELFTGKKGDMPGKYQDCVGLPLDNKHSLQLENSI